MCQCPLGLIPHCYGYRRGCYRRRMRCVNALSGLYLIVTKYVKPYLAPDSVGCQCPLGLIPHCYPKMPAAAKYSWRQVSMPSRAYTSLLPRRWFSCRVSHCSGVNALSGLYLIVTAKYTKPYMAPEKVCVNALSGLYLIVTVPLQKPRFYAISRAYFCRYLSEYSDNNSFSCMLTIWTYFMR